MSTSVALPMASWSPGRKWAAGLFATVCLVGLSCAAIYLSAVIFRKASCGVRLVHHVNRWWLYETDPACPLDPFAP